MLKKLLFIGLGISIIVVKKSVSYLSERKEQASGQAHTLMNAEAAPSRPEAAEQTNDFAAAESGVSPAQKKVAETEADDLTEINGIGPTYAKRLMDAGITTFAALSKSSPEELRAITQATGKAADTESWINQAADLN